MYTKIILQRQSLKKTDWSPTDFYIYSVDEQPRGNSITTDATHAINVMIERHVNNVGLFCQINSMSKKKKKDYLEALIPVHHALASIVRVPKLNKYTHQNKHA